MIALNRNGIRDKHDKRISFSFQVATTGPSLPTSSDLFCETGISALEAARHHQNRLDGTHTLDTHMANKSGKMTVKPLSNGKTFEIVRDWYHFGPWKAHTSARASLLVVQLMAFIL